MKKSKQVPASLIITLAAGIAGCGSAGSYTECRDASGNLVPASYCTTGGYAGAHWVNVQRGGYGGTGGGSSSGGSFGG